MGNFLIFTLILKLDILTKLPLNLNSLSLASKGVFSFLMVFLLLLNWIKDNLVFFLFLKIIIKKRCWSELYTRQRMGRPALFKQYVNCRLEKECQFAIRRWKIHGTLFHLGGRMWWLRWQLVIDRPFFFFSSYHPHSPWISCWPLEKFRFFLLFYNISSLAFNVLY